MQNDFASSPLVRLLQPWQGDPVPPPAMDFAERLSLWVSAFEAIGLQPAQQAIRALPAAGAPAAAAARARAAAELAEDLRRVRSVLAQAIAREFEADASSYAPFQDRHLDVQRQTDLMLAPLREHAREALGRSSQRLRQLAALDQLFAQLLAPREQVLLPRVATLLRRRFEQLRRAAQQPADDAAPPADWLADFTREWRHALLAELDCRLAPVSGLAEALAHESNP